MLRKEQRMQVMDLYRSGMNISNIAKKVGISRQSVYNVIRDDVEKDAEIHGLKKMVRKAELRKKLEELREPIKTRSGLDRLNDVVYNLILRVLLLWEFKTNWDPPHCFYCGEPLKYYVEKSSEGKVISEGYDCRRCGRDFPFP